MSFQIEDTVNIKFTTLTGVVKGATMDYSTLTVQYLVEYIDNEGEQQSRYFSVDQIDAA